MRAAGLVGTAGLIFAPRFASDSCSDVEFPHICGMAAGLYFRFPLTGRWRRRHITLTEACGTKLCLIILSEYFPGVQLMVESDATSALAAAIASSTADDLIFLHRRAKEVPGYRDATQRAWVTHVKGWANGPTDAGSRNKMKEMQAMADALGIRLREVPIPQRAWDFMADVLDHTTDTTSL